MKRFMSAFIFWCLKRLAILTVKYTRHPEGMFQLGSKVVVNGKRYPFTFESNTWQPLVNPYMNMNDIRNKAIDDFFEELQEYECEDMWLRLKMSSIYEIAEQLKEKE